MKGKNLLVVWLKKRVYGDIILVIIIVIYSHKA